MKSRQEQILCAIIKNFITSASPISSHALEDILQFSSATIRSEMSELTEQEYLIQPYTSAGRVPTQKGYRFFVDILAKLELEKNEAESSQAFHLACHEYYTKKAREKIYDAIVILARAVSNIAFATVPGKERAIFFGISQALRQPEFLQKPNKISEVFEVLEGDFVDFLHKLKVGKDSPRIMIGQENIFPEFDSCSLLVQTYSYQDYKGKIGILGPMRMDYAFNLGVLKQTSNWIET